MTGSSVPAVTPDSSFATALRQAIAHRGLALNRIRTHLADRGLHVGIATLSTWQSGRRVPRDDSLAVITALEELLQVPPGWLTVRIPPARTDQAAARQPYAVVDYAEALGRLLDRLRREAHGRLRNLTVVEEVQVGADRSTPRRRVVQSVVAVQPVDRIIVAHQGEPGCDADLLAVTGLSGCRNGRIARSPEAGAILAELLLDRVLAVGDTAVVHYEIEDRTALPSTNYYRFDEWGGTHYVLEVQFDRTALPVRVSSYRRPQAKPAADRDELLLTPDARAHLLEAVTEPGLLGIDWEWD
ncbi:hypothetical protein HPO96_36205 [Kribbella sandramycini]|uniref:Helix-turn-helix protein n=1 Tax=Kribbella sandramycini TaxID=60450 RepID=A0A7Y4L982_9ACTN|nr:hypothetical protein [Kribbella sandramycini]MBB6570174.1 hypothetical protein [Kribbella sandramycini]NOL45701.1 hypothetical protein [Kribbella sandramycini]